MFYSSRSIKNRFRFMLSLQKVITFIIASKKAQKIGLRKYLYTYIPQFLAVLAALEHQITCKYPYSLIAVLNFKIWYIRNFTIKSVINWSLMTGRPK